MRDPIQKITIEDVQYIAFKLARVQLSFDEPIPDFSTRFPQKLESCIETPFQMFSKRDLYPSLIGKASILFYLLNKNHPFQNGNKRIAVASLLAFLSFNGKWVKTSVQELYEFAVWIASSPSREKDSVQIVIENFIKKHLVTF